MQTDIIIAAGHGKACIQSAVVTARVAIASRGGGYPGSTPQKPDYIAAGLSTSLAGKEEKISSPTSLTLICISSVL